MALESLEVEVEVVLGRTRLPIRQLLRMGRGALLALDPSPDDAVDILANGLAIARGRVVVEAGTIAVEVTELVRGPETTGEAGATVGGHLKPASAATPSQTDAEAS